MSHRSLGNDNRCVVLLPSSEVPLRGAPTNLLGIARVAVILSPRTATDAKLLLRWLRNQQGLMDQGREQFPMHVARNQWRLNSAVPTRRANI